MSKPDHQGTQQTQAHQMSQMRRPMGRGPRATLPGEKPKDLSRSFKRLLETIRPHWLSLGLALLFAISSTVFAILGPKILGQATTLLFEGAVAKAQQLPGAAIDFQTIGQLLLQLAVLYLISALLGYLQGFLLSGLSMKITYQFRESIARKINRLPIGYFDRHAHGDILSRVTNDVDLVGNTLNQGLSSITTSITTLLGVLVMMLTINWMMTLATVMIIPISTVLITFVIRRSQKYFREQQEVLGQTNGHVEEMYGGHIVMKAFNGEAASIETFDRLNQRLHQSAWKSQFMSGMMQPIMHFVSNIGYVAISILGGWLAIRGVIAIGDIQAFIQYMRNFTHPLSAIASATNVFQSTLAAAERVFEFIDETEESPDPEQTEALQPVSGAVTFDRVQFGYQADQSVIHDFSASIKPGQKVAIVGPTGAGKTTLVKLLMRFYDVQGGAIRLDNRDIRSFRRADLRSFFGMVLQDTWLFHGTICDNIRYGHLQASDEAVMEAAQSAYLHHFIHTLPHGYQMVLNEEASNISQGQKQLLTIARALLSKPTFLILDEATSSVDTRTESLIQKALNQLMEGRTSFIIAHRLSTIRNADLILVIRDGNIVEQGTHQALLAMKGFYHTLYQSQFDAS